MRRISVYIITLNEEKRLHRTLKAAWKVADEVVVVDSGSQDSTVALAQATGAKTAYHPWETICIQKHFAQELCSNKWVLSLDADEELGPELIEEILSWKQSEDDGVTAYRLHISDVFPGQKKPPFFCKSYNLIRLYRRDKADMPENAGTSDRVVLTDRNARIGQFRHQVYHYSYLDLWHMTNKMNRYSSEAAESALAHGRRYGIVRLLFDFPVQFFRAYVLSCLFSYGKLGFLAAVNTAYFRYMKVMKSFEINELETSCSVKYEKERA